MKLKYGGQFKRDYKSIQKRGWDVKLIHDVLVVLDTGKPLKAKYRDHPLLGDYEGFRECHLKGDWLLIYRIDDGCLMLKRTGSQSDLFG